MSNNFNFGLSDRIPQNWIDKSHSHKTSMSFGKLYPLLVEETMPGDKWVMSTTKFVRCLPLVAPVMHQFSINEHWFYVPNRILWDGWEEFITVRQETTERLMPTVRVFSADRKPVNITINQMLGVYMGLPIIGVTAGAGGTPITALPLAGYVQIWNNFFRQTQIMQEIEFTLSDGLNTTLSGGVNYDYAFGPLFVLWRRDYFTASLPSPTLGINVPAGSNMNVLLNQTATGVNKTYKNDRTAFAGYEGAGVSPNVGGNALYAVTSGLGIVIDPNDQWYVQPSTIETLRSAFALQAYLEKENRAGGRYKDIIEAHYPVKIPDYRVSLPEYIGSTYQNLVISEVLSQTQYQDGGSTGDRLNLGDMAGHGISVKKGGRFEYTTLEHGYMYCLVSIVPELTYMNRGIHRMWRREYREDFPMPEFANLGEQAILNEELHAGHVSPQGTFGYVPRYSEMKYSQSRVSGEMADTLSFWHLGQALPTNVALNPAFLSINEAVYDLDRMFAVQNTGDFAYVDNFIADVYFDIKVKRPLPRYGMPANLTGI